MNTKHYKLLPRHWNLNLHDSDFVRYKYPLYALKKLYLYTWSLLLETTKQIAVVKLFKQSKIV